MGSIFETDNYPFPIPSLQWKAVKVVGVAVLAGAVAFGEHAHIDVEAYTPMAPASNFVVTSTGATFSGATYVYTGSPNSGPTGAR